VEGSGVNSNPIFFNSSAPPPYAKSTNGNKWFERGGLQTFSIPVFCWLFIAANLALASVSSFAFGDERKCDEVIRNPEKTEFPPYQVGDTVFKVPFASSSWLSSGPTKVNGISRLFYSLDEQRFISEHKDKAKFECRGWCDRLLIGLNQSHRQNNVMYRVGALSKLSRKVPVADQYMVNLFQSRQDKKITTYWKLLPERRAELRCGSTEVPAPSCTWNFDFSPWVEADVTFDRKYLPEAEKILDSVTRTLHCLNEGK